MAAQDTARDQVPGRVGAGHVVRPALTADDRAGFAVVWNTITPREPITGDSIAERWARQPERLYLVAELEGRIAGVGLVAPSDSPGRIFMAVRVLPDCSPPGPRRGSVRGRSKLTR